LSPRRPAGARWRMSCYASSIGIVAAPVEGGLSTAVDACIGVIDAAPCTGPWGTGPLNDRFAHVAAPGVWSAVSVVGGRAEYRRGHGTGRLVHRNLRLHRTVGERSRLAHPLAQ